MVLMLLTRQLEILKIRERINSQVQEEMGHSQREYVLRQQLKAIKGELGEMDDEGAESEEFQKKIAEAAMPEDVEKVAFKQLNRLKQMQPSSAEYTVTRTYLEWLVELPWSRSTEDVIDIKAVREILDEDPGYTRRDAVYFHLADALATLGRGPEALPLFELLVSEFPATEFLVDANLRIEELKVSMDLDGP